MNHKLLLVLFLILPSISFGQPAAKRTFSRGMLVDKESTFELICRYGNIHIINSTNDSLTIRAEVEAFASNQERVQKMYDGIEIKISGSGNVVRAETVFNPGINSLIESFKGITNKLIPYDSKLEINFYISAPDYLNMDIENRYGNIELADNTGSLELSLSNGSLYAGYLNKVSSLNLVLSNAKIKRITEGNIDASFSEIDISESEKLTFNSISSRIDLKKALVVETKSKSDKYFLGAVETLHGESYFTTFNAASISREISLEPRFGELNVDHVEKKTELISLKSNSADINLSFDQGMSYDVEIRHSNSFVVLPEQNADLSKERTGEDGKEFLIKGSVGKRKSSTKVIIEASRGDIYLK